MSSSSCVTAIESRPIAWAVSTSRIASFNSAVWSARCRLLGRSSSSSLSESAMLMKPAGRLRLPSSTLAVGGCCAGTPSPGGPPAAGCASGLPCSDGASGPSASCAAAAASGCCSMGRAVVRCYSIMGLSSPHPTTTTPSSICRQLATRNSAPDKYKACQVLAISYCTEYGGFLVALGPGSACLGLAWCAPTAATGPSAPCDRSKRTQSFDQSQWVLTHPLVAVNR